MRHTAAVIATVALLAPSLSTQAPVGPTAGLAVELKPTGGRGLTEVHGIKVGSVTLTERPTGCTVVLVDGEGVPGGVSQRGGAPGTSETDLLHPLNMVDKVNAIVLAGGSAYGLDARIGVVRYLEEHKTGWRVPTGVVPIVPSAILFDLGVGNRPDVRPTADCGYRAATAASAAPVAEGNVGAGAGATVGKMGGRLMMKGGLGSAAFTLPNGLVVAALAATNGVGDVIDPDTGTVIAGARAPDGKSLLDIRKFLRSGGLDKGAAPRAGENTTIAVVATNARLTKTEINRVATDGRRRVRTGHQSLTHDGRRRHGVRARNRALERPGQRQRDRGARRRCSGRSDRPSGVEGGVDRRHSVGQVAGNRPQPDQVVARRGITRRRLIESGVKACAAGSILRHSAAAQSGTAPAIVKSDAARPAIQQGVAVGDVTTGRAVVWSRTDRPARMLVEYATSEKFENVLRRTGPAALESSDFTARLVLTDLPANQRIFYRVSFQDLTDLRAFSTPELGSFRTPPDAQHPRDVTLAWSADTVGQGWGINPDWGGLRLYRTMRDAEPDVFIHCGDTIYADGVIQPRVKLDDGSMWTNIVTEAKSKVAQTLDDYRGCYKYNLLDEHMRTFNAGVGQIALWDDHEVRDNWYEARDLSGDERYQVKSMALLSARARQAFLEFNPVGRHADDAERIHRTIGYGPLLEIFALDLRSYRGANSANRQASLSPESAIFGADQLASFKARLASSRATWKVIASDMPIGLIVGDGADRFEAFANGDPGPPLGRELEVADLLRFIRDRRIRNVVWITETCTTVPPTTTIHRGRGSWGSARSGSSSPARCTPARSDRTRWIRHSGPRRSSTACRRG